MKSTDLFFRNDKFIRRFFAQPLTTAIIFFCSGSIISLLAWGLHLGSIVLLNGCNVGFFYRPNWGFMYLVLLPIIFCLMSSILTKSRHAVNVLSSPEIKVIEPALPSNGQSFEDSLYARMEKWRPLIYCFALGAAFIITGVTVTLLLWKPYATGDDWAAVMPWFAVFIFLVQGFYIFLGVFWVLTFASFILSFIRLAVGRATGFRRNSVFYDPERRGWVRKFTSSIVALLSRNFGAIAGFRLNPMLYDPTRRMGLGIMGGLLNQFAVATLLFESYVAIYGIQAAADIHKLSLGKYFQETLSSTKLSQLFSLADFPRPFHFTGAGVFALVALSVLLWIVYIAIPVFCLCPRLIRMRRNTWRHHARRFESANRLNNNSLAKPLDRKFKALAASSFWPNGPTAGLGLAFALLVIPLLAVYPPVGGYLATSGVIAAGYKALKSVA